MFVDKQGRLFGKINIIDFLALIFLLFFIIPTGYLGYKAFNKSKVYDKNPNQCDNDLLKIQAKVNNFLKEHKRYRKYFE